MSSVAKFLRAGWLLAVLLLCGCAPMMVALEKIGTIRRAAVMSAVGDKFTVKTIGLTVFGNDERDFPIDSWGIDQFVVNKVQSVLAGRFEVRPVAYDKSAFFLAKGEVAKIAASVRAQAKSTDIDAYIVVTPGFSQWGGTYSTYGDPSRTLRGLGIVSLSAPLLLGHKAYLFALHQVTVVDGHDFSVLANAEFPIREDTVLATTSIRGPSREVDESWIPRTLDAAQSTRLKTALTELLDRNLPATIENTHLLQQPGGG